MSKLTETFCFKVSKEMKSFLDDSENPSDYVRQLVLQNMRIRNKVKDISSLEVIDGESYYQYKEEELHDLMKDEIMRTVRFHIFNETKIILK